MAPRDDNHDGEARRWETGLKLLLTEFVGNLDLDAFVDWLTVVEEKLAFKDVPMERRVPLIFTRLHGRAAAWWQQSKVVRANQGKSWITTWEKLTRRLRAKFLPFNYHCILYQKLQNLRQGGRSINDYSEEFYQLLARNALTETPEQLVSCYIGGLSVQY